MQGMLRHGWQGCTWCGRTIGQRLRHQARFVWQEGLIGTLIKSFIIVYSLILGGAWLWYGLQRGLASILQDFLTLSVEEQQRRMATLSEAVPPTLHSMLMIALFVVSAFLVGLLIVLVIEFVFRWLEPRGGANRTKEDSP